EFVIPWSRMHWANCTVAAICCAESADAGLLPALPNDLHACAAAWYVLLVGLRSPPPPRSKLPLLSGSGKSRTPWARMHRARASGPADAETLAGDTTFADDEAAALTTPTPDELCEQAVASRPNAINPVRQRDAVMSMS